MTPIIIPPDAVEVAIIYLKERLPALGIQAEVHHRIPDRRPAKFVTVRLTGGTEIHRGADLPQLTVDAWAKSPQDAHDLAQAARGIIRSMEGRTIAGTACYRTALFGGLADLPDPDSAQPRFRFTISVGMRSRQIT